MKLSYRNSHFAALALGALTLLGGCASSPSGGPTAVTANRLQATLTLNQNLNANFYYAVAFDDNPTDGTGPVGIEGNTPILNGVAGGSWRLLVVWHRNTFEVYRRRVPTDPATEERILVTPFVGTPRASGNSLDFTINLDATLGDGSFFFPHTAGATPVLATDRFDLNVVTTNTILRDAVDNRIKPVDTLGPQTIATPVLNFQIDSTRITDITDDSGDKRPGVDTSFETGPGQVNYGQIDIVNLRLAITRG